MGPKPKRCVVCGEMDDRTDHRDEDYYVTRCPESASWQRFEPVYLRDVGPA